MINKLTEIRNNIYIGKLYKYNDYYNSVSELDVKETTKRPFRFDIINNILSYINKEESNYLEIGVRDPNDNFNKIMAKNKFSVDPGIEFENNPVDFKVTSDEFFSGLKNNQFLNNDIKFDVIFIDGLHLASQVKKDIENSLNYLSPNGFIVLHDCNPPSEYHAREDYYNDLTPAKKNWNGTTWKAFVEFRKSEEFSTFCIDTDWGIGIITKAIDFGKPNIIENEFYDYNIFNEYRKESLNLVTYEDFIKKLGI
jgi:hypothetical protein